MSVKETFFPPKCFKQQYNNSKEKFWVPQSRHEVKETTARI